ncbi:MAG: NADH-quinone oxidoreductase subunit L [Acidobacteriota bacterium]
MFLAWFWLIPLIPLLGAATIGLFIGRRSDRLVSAVGCSSVGLSFLLAAGALVELFQLPEIGRQVEANLFTWIASGVFKADFAFLLDPLSAVMIVLVTGIGWLIHIYSIGYMAGDSGYYRFFAYLNLFIFAMSTLVLANNYLLMFVGWEGVGLCSYLLIGYYFGKKSAGDAAKKAFIVNRIGDVGFVLGMLAIFSTFGTLHFTSVFDRVVLDFPQPEWGFGVLTTIALCLFIGAVGKSAQVPLYVWLPDAMEGPTPVSALIHAATMVTAGIYMVARSAAIYSRTPEVLFWIAVIGTATAFLAATIALTQTDIKKVLAYSTISQLGYMFLALGAGAFSAAVFHLMTHAFFKALLFLGAGSVIHAVHDQEMSRMGNLRRYMPQTFLTMLVASLAIAGVPLLSGFFSKDAILWEVFLRGEVYLVFWGIGLVVALLTAFYMFRLIFLTFFGAERFDPHHPPHESPGVMTQPLMVLAFFSIVAGFAGLPAWLGTNRLDEFLAFSFRHGLRHGETAHHSVGLELGLTLAAISVGLLGIGLAWTFYVRNPERPERVAVRAGALYTFLKNKWYVDEAYDAVIVRPVVDISRGVLWKIVDAGAIDGAVNGLAGVLGWSSDRIKRMQNGLVRSYALWILAGGCLVLLLYIANS